MKHKIKLMKEGKVSKVLLKFGIPSIIGFTITSIYNFVDAIFVGKLGTNAIGAISVVFPISLIMIGIGLLFGSGAASYISRLLGEKDLEKANNVATGCVLMSTLIGSLFIVLFLFGLKTFLNIFGATDKIIPLALDYGYIFVAGSIFTILNLTLNHIIRAEGLMTFSMFSLIIGAVLNIILDPIFIFYLNMGIKGAAIATLISQGVSTILLFGFLYSKYSLLKINFKELSLLGEDYLEMIGVGVPYCVAQLLAGFSIGLINSKASLYGETAIAASGIAYRIFSVGIYAMIGFSKGYQPIAGFNYGAKQINRLKDLTKTAVLWATTFCIVLAVLQIYFSENLISLFTDDREVILLGSKFLKSASYVLSLFGIQIILMTLFLSVGKAKEGFLLSLGRQGYFLIPIIFILPMYMGIKGVIYAQPIADVLMTILTLIIYYKKSHILYKVYN